MPINVHVGGINKERRDGLHSHDQHLIKYYSTLATNFLAKKLIPTQGLVEFQLLSTKFQKSKYLPIDGT